MKLSKKQIFSFIIALVCIVAGYLITLASFPKNAGRYPFFIFLLLLDLYVWGMFKRKLFTYNTFLKTSLAILYWLPLFALAGATLITYVVKSHDWLPWVQNLVFGSIFTFYVAKFFMAVIIFFADIVRWIKGLWDWVSFSKSKEPVPGTRKYKRSEFMQQMALVTGGLVVTTMFTGMFRWVHRFDLRRVNVSLKGLDPAFDGFRIAHISDLHLGTWADVDALEEAVFDIMSANPDMIVFTGDLVNYSTDEAHRFVDTLKRLSAPNGVFAVLGNHDYGDYVKWPSESAKKKNMDDLLRVYQKSGWTLLRNSSAVVSRGEARLAVVGVENWSANTRFPRKGDLKAAIAGVEDVPAKVLLSHDPSHWNAQVTESFKDIGLTLSGHTHGFQFGIEIPGFKWSPAQYLYKQWAGLYEAETGQFLYVNRGLGSIGYPGRIGILPEITVIELNYSNQQA
ncbi:MAG TPA: metallophosphoesterase [Bacteroidales bacterium]|nr:metallophosphoesterase [Bacteroidales bacterium]